MDAISSVIVFCVLISSFATAQRASCSDNECVNIYQCKPIVDLINSSPKPLSVEVRRQLISFQCGLDVNTVKVCCPSQSSGGSSDSTDLKRHRNVGLLSQSCGSMSSEDKLIGGEKAGLFEFPWMVLISYRSANGKLDFRCGGSLINDRYVLTAAHCISHLKNRNTLAGIRLGEYDITNGSDCETSDGITSCSQPVQDIQIAEVIPHPQYNPKQFANDIGLLRLIRKATLNDNVAPVCLPIADNLRSANLKHFTVTGWGRTENATRSNILLKVNVPIVSKAVCAKAYERNAPITDRQICAGGVFMKDSCTGDSGGPLQAVQEINRDTRYVQYGVVSFGPTPCGQGGKPGVYTRITDYMQWILDTIKP